MSRAYVLHALVAALAAGTGACSSQATPLPRDGGNAGAAGTTDGGAAAATGSDGAPDSGGDGAFNGCVEPLPSRPILAMVTFDHSGCAARAPSACEIGGTPVGVNSQLLFVAQTLCYLPNYTWVEVTFDDGCPRSLNLKSIRDQVDPNLVSCLAQQLGTVRWSCAEAVTCTQVEWDTLP